MNISAPFIRRPVATTLIMLAIAVAGLASFPMLPVAPLPKVDFPTVSVSARLPGASPETMASAVAQPLERQFAQIAGVTQMTSTSTLGSTSITLQFDLNRDIDAAAQDVQAAITAASRQLPTDMPSPPTYRKTNPADSPILVIGVHSASLPLTVVDDYADTILAQQISQIDGVSQVSLGGEQKPAIRIQVDPAKLAAKGLTLEDIRAVISAATTNAAKGTLYSDNRSVTLAANDQLSKATDYGEVIVAYRNGAAVRVKDVGQAIEGPENLYAGAWDGDERAILLVVSKQPGANVIETVDKINAALPQLKAVMPQAISVDILSDRTETIRASVHDVEVTLAVTIALVVLVILLFLRNVRVTLIPGVVVPLSLLGALAVMYLCGFSLDNISLMALTISVGFVVDDAIVVVENIYRHIEDRSMPRSKARAKSGLPCCRSAFRWSRCSSRCC
jgi:HAE1 family hydrophobic/amphiphilic exporter-1/multidrug efflux pump